MARQFLLSFLFLFFLSVDGIGAMLPAFLDWEIAGQWSAYGYHNLQNTDIDDEIMSDTRVLLENRMSWQEQNAFLKMDAEWRYETFRGMDNKSGSDVRFRDVYAEIKRDQYDLAVGQKKVTWGKLDDITILDRISPQDYTHFVLYDKQERKDPALMIQHQWFGWEGLNLETIFLPVFQPSEMDFFGTNWAAFGHLKQAVAEDPVYTSDQKDIVSGITIQDDTCVTSRSLKNSQVGVRLRGRAREVDYGVYYLNLYNSVPVLKESNPAGNATKRFLFEPTAAHLDALVSSGAAGDDLRLTTAHPRVNAVGLDWETVWGVFGLRGETAVFSGMPFLREDFSYTEKDQMVFGVGIDHTTADQWYVDLQYVQEYVLNYEDLYSAEEAPYYFAGTVSKNFLRGKIFLNFDWMWQVSYNDVMLNPEATYKWDRAGIDFSLGSFFFEGKRSKTLFGRYDQNDVVYVKLGGKF